MRYFLIILALVFLCPAGAEAKKKRKRKVTTSDVIHASDSLLSAKISDTLFRFCTFDKSSYFTYRKGKGSRFVELPASEKLPKKFEKAYIRYTFLMPYGECALYDTVSGVISLEVVKEDTAFSLAAEPDTSFIPAIAARQEACNFISYDSAMAIAENDTLKHGVTPPYAVLKYIPASKSFSWAVFSLLWNERDFNAEHEPKKDVVIIDAVTGDIIRHIEIPYTMDIADIY